VNLYAYCRSLAEKADPFIKRWLLDLARSYAAKLHWPPEKRNFGIPGSSSGSAIADALGHRRRLTDFQMREWFPRPPSIPMPLASLAGSPESVINTICRIRFELKQTPNRNYLRIPNLTRGLGSGFGPWDG
jgi:hypothetical protein